MGPAGIEHTAIKYIGNSTFACVGGFNWDQTCSLVGPANTSNILLLLLLLNLKSSTIIAGSLILL